MPAPPCRKKIRVKITSSLSVTISPTVAAVVIAPAVIDAWLALTVAQQLVLRSAQLLLAQLQRAVGQPLHHGVDADGQLVGQVGHAPHEGGHHERQHAAEERPARRP